MLQKCFQLLNPFLKKVASCLSISPCFCCVVAVTEEQSSEQCPVSSGWTAQAVTPVLGSGWPHAHAHPHLHPSPSHSRGGGTQGLPEDRGTAQPRAWGMGLEQGKGHGLLWDPHSCCRLQENPFSSSWDSSAPEGPSRGHPTAAAAEGNGEDQEHWPVLSLCNAFLEEDLAFLGLLGSPRDESQPGQNHSNLAHQEISTVAPIPEQILITDLSCCQAH